MTRIAKAKWKCFIVIIRVRYFETEELEVARMYGYLFIGVFLICLSKESSLSYLLYDKNNIINRLITNSGHFVRDVRIDGILFRVRQMMDQPKIVRSLLRDQAQERDLEMREGWGKKRAGDSFGFNFFINLISQYFFLAYKRR